MIHCPTCNEGRNNKFCHECGRLLQQDGEPPRVSVSAAAYAFSGGSDGAYNLIAESTTVEDWLLELGKFLRETDWNLLISGRGEHQRGYISINIGPAGSYEDLPIG